MMKSNCPEINVLGGLIKLKKIGDYAIYVPLILSGRHLDDLFLLLPGDPGLQQLSTDPLGSLVQLQAEVHGLQGLSLSGLQSLHVGRMQQHLLLILVLRFGCQLSLGNGEEDLSSSLHVISSCCSCNGCALENVDALSGGKS